MDRINIHAMAKINLGLDVLGRRENGYHDVKMVMQTVNLYDTLSFQRKNHPGIRIITEDETLPADKDNLIYKAASLLFEKYQVTEGVTIHLQKRIPIAAGMAGGSTDAAATLVGINELFALGATKEELKELGVKLGADIPYCMEGGTALSEGIGEILTPLPPAPRCHVVIVKPSISVSTGYVYENLHVEGLKKHPDIDGMVQAIYEKDLRGVCSRMENVLETVTETKYPVISRIKIILKEQGALNSLMSGSGPTVFGIFEKEETAGKALGRIEESGLGGQQFLTTFTDSSQMIMVE